jgi:hypothetical protein
MNTAEPMFSGTITGGMFHMDNREEFDGYLNSFQDQSRVSLVIIEEWQQRTLNQNAWYRVVCREIGKFLGYREDELHEVFQEMFNDGQSTTKLSVKEFSWYLEMVINFAETFLNFRVPDPQRMVIRSGPYLESSTI